jgi:hypothetical protein
MRRWRTAKEVDELLEQYRASGMTQMAYCQQTGVGRSTLGRYLRLGSGGGQRLVRVKVKRTEATEEGGGFTLVLSNGRRIECGWRFGETELARLIRVAET